MYRDLGPRMGLLESTGSSATSGISGARDIDCGRASPVTGLQSHGVPLKFFYEFPVPSPLLGLVDAGFVANQLFS